MTRFPQVSDTEVPTQGSAGRTLVDFGMERSVSGRCMLPTEIKVLRDCSTFVTPYDVRYGPVMPPG